MKKKIIKIFSGYFIILMVILSCLHSPLEVKAVDDNYSTYLFNQDINVDNDKAHLLSEASDGSNSYRNLFQSNFLFPAKLQNSMLSTTATTSFSHYSFNQFYFDNLDNKYAYQSNDNSENFETSIIPNEFDVLNGSNIVNGSLEQQDSEFGKYNATYSFDDYNETESNFGNYNGTYSFENETDSFLNGIGTITGNTEISDNFDNHNKVLNMSTLGTTPIRQCNTFSNQVGVKYIEYYFTTSNNSFNYQSMYFSIDGNNLGSSNILLIIQTYAANFRITYGDGLGRSTSEYISGAIDINRLYHIKVKIDIDNDIWSIWLDGVLKKDNVPFYLDNLADSFNSFIILSSNTNDYSLYLDAFGIVGLDGYSENDNINSYGKQSELENDFSIDYKYNTSISINNTLDYRNNVIQFQDYNNLELLAIQNTFIEQTNGIIEFSFIINSTIKPSSIRIYDGSIECITFILSSGGKDRYFDGSYHDFRDSVINQWFNFKIIFDCTLDSFDLYVENVLLVNDGNFRNLGIALDKIQISSYKAEKDYTFKYDNIDLSWSNGYYENRINELIPLNDSNYNMYKSEIGKELNEVLVFPNSDIDADWTTVPMAQPRYSVIDDYSTTDYLYHALNWLDYNTFGIEIPNFQTNISKVSIYALVKRDIPAENDIHFNFYNGIEWLTDKSLTLTSTYTLLNVSYSSLNLNSSYTDYRVKIGLPDAHTTGISYLASLYIGYSYYLESINITTEKEINYSEIGKPVLFNLYYSMCISNIDSISLYIYNYDIENYFLINDFIDYFTFNEYSFEFNESAYFRLDKFKLMIYSSNSSNTNLFIDKLSVNITNVIQNNDGFQEILIYNHRYDISDNYKGYGLFELRIYNNSIKYRYSEINFDTENYVYSWIEYNTSSIEVKNVEIQSHCRYGLNTLDIEIINFYYLIYINYDLDNIIEFREQSRKELSVQKIKSSFNYTSHTKNYVDLTGIIGNYSYNCFNGMRSLYGATTEIFHRYFLIPYFSQDIDVSIDVGLEGGSGTSPDEPTPPTEYYWSYDSFETQYSQTININVGNWTVEFTQMKSVPIIAKHYYTPEVVSKSDLGNWKWKIKFTDAFSYTVDFNFMRNAIRTVLNLVLLLFQYFGFLIVSSLSYVFMYIGTSILVFLWNYLVYYLFIGFMWIFWYIYSGLVLLFYWLWSMLIIFYETVLIPFGIWLEEVLLPIILEWIIIFMAFGITCVIYILTLGQIDFDSTYDIVYDILWLIVNELLGFIDVFLNNLYYVFLFMLLYVYNLLILYFTFLYCRARGYKKKAERIYYTLMFYLTPVLFIVDMLKKLYDLSPYP